MKKLLLLFLLGACTRHETMDPDPADEPVVQASPSPPAMEPIRDPPVDAGTGSVTVGEYETEYAASGKDEPRAENIELASTRIRVRIGPGEEFSFNDSVGPRTMEDGFRDAPVIFMGEVAEGVGGGVCQVSSTLHAAALNSALEVMSRRPHTRKSKYIEMGLDATVAYPPECKGDHRQNASNGKNKDCYSVDLVLKNPFESPVDVVTDWEEVREGMRRLTVSVTSADSPVLKASHRTSFSGTKEFERKYRKTGKVKTATYKRLAQSGQPGRKAVTVFSYSMADGTSKEVRYSSEYKPVNEMWLVGLQWDMSGPPPWEN